MERVVLTPRQAAAAIGVSESSLRRWCDQGRLTSERTGGGHRRIELGALIEFARRNGFRVTHSAAQRARGRGGRKIKEEELKERCYQHIVRGDDLALRELVTDWVGEGHTLAAVCDRLLAPALVRIGHEWSQGQVDIFEEHRATQIVLELLTNARELSPTPANDAPVALCAALGGDIYSVAPGMAALVLREVGWKSVGLGANTPYDSVRRAVENIQPSLIALSVSYVEDDASLLDEYEPLYRHAREQGAAVAIGGRALTPEIRRRISADFFGDTMTHLATFADGLQRHMPAERIASAGGE